MTGRSRRALSETVLADPERCRHLSYELHDKETVISAATIVMPRAHRKELTGLKALKGIGRRSPYATPALGSSPVVG